jgi:hypothetical protein
LGIAKVILPAAVLLRLEVPDGGREFSWTTLYAVLFQRIKAPLSGVVRCTLYAAKLFGSVQSREVDVADRAMGGPVRPACRPRVFWSCSHLFFLIEVFGAPLSGANECKEFGRNVGTREMDVEQVLCLVGALSRRFKLFNRCVR